MRNDIKVIIYASDASQGSWRAFDVAINQAIKNKIASETSNNAVTA